MPSHTHNVGKASAGNFNQPGNAYRFAGNAGTTSGSTGGGGSHSHGMSGGVSNSSSYNSGSTTPTASGSTTPTSFAPKYIDVIICAKD
jgi:hypothetical protein